MIEMLITHYEERPCLWNVGHEDYMNRSSKELVYSQTDLLMSDRNDISREDYIVLRLLKKSAKSLEVSLFLCACVAPLFSGEKMSPSLATRAAKHFFWLPAQ